jgi:hypothetical protein
MGKYPFFSANMGSVAILHGILWVLAAAVYYYFYVRRGRA